MDVMMVTKIVIPEMKVFDDLLPLVERHGAVSLFREENCRIFSVSIAGESF
jgi:hypothetical protein